jgi:hypothetical protein
MVLPYREKRRKKHYIKSAIVRRLWLKVPPFWREKKSVKPRGKNRGFWLRR